MYLRKPDDPWGERPDEPWGLAEVMVFLAALVITAAVGAGLVVFFDSMFGAAPAMVGFGWWSSWMYGLKE